MVNLFARGHNSQCAIVVSAHYVPFEARREMQCYRVILFGDEAAFASYIYCKSENAHIVASAAHKVVSGLNGMH